MNVINKILDCCDLFPSWVLTASFTHLNSSLVIMIHKTQASSILLSCYIRLQFLLMYFFLLVELKHACIHHQPQYIIGGFPVAPAVGANATRTAQVKMVRFQAPFGAKTPLECDHIYLSSSIYHHLSIFCIYPNIVYCFAELSWSLFVCLLYILLVNACNMIAASFLAMKYVMLPVGMHHLVLLRLLYICSVLSLIANCRKGMDQNV